MSGTRRDFLKTAGVLGLGGLTAGQAGESAYASEGVALSDEWMGVLVDIPKCVGCRRCEFACKEGAQKAAENRAERARNLGREDEARSEFGEARLFQPEPLDSYEDKLVFAERRFSLEDKYQEDLVNEDRIVTEGLETEFYRHGISLAKDGTITVMEDGQEWLIISEGQSYTVKKTAENQLDVYSYPRHLRRPESHCYTKITRFPNPKDPIKPLYVKYNCLHCNRPACVSACLVGAFHKLETGPVLYDAWKCMGCRYCMVACPFGIPTYEYENALTPQVRKCTLCSEEGHPNKGKVPACMKICPVEVMTHGKRSELLEVAQEKIDKNPEVYAGHIYGAHEAGGTAWLYLAPKEISFKELGFVPLGTAAPPLRTEVIQHGVFKYFIPPLAWYGLLGAAMWVSRPSPRETEHPATVEPVQSGVDHRPRMEHVHATRVAETTGATE